jgi:hypothetical protein
MGGVADLWWALLREMACDGMDYWQFGGFMRTYPKDL